MWIRDREAAPLATQRAVSKELSTIILRRALCRVTAASQRICCATSVAGEGQGRLSSMAALMGMSSSVGEGVKSNNGLNYPSQVVRAAGLAVQVLSGTQWKFEGHALVCDGDCNHM